MGVCGGPSLVREDRDGRTAGEPVVVTTASLGSYVRMGEPLKASKRESRPKTRHPGSDRAPGDPRETTGSIGGAWTAGNRLERSRPNGRGGFDPDVCPEPGRTRTKVVVGAVTPVRAGVCVGRWGVPVAESALAPPGPIPNPVVTQGSAGEYCGGDSVGGEAAAGTPHRQTHARQHVSRPGAGWSSGSSLGS